MKPTVLIILDGWGVAPPSSGNAITQADPKFFNKLTHDFPTGLLQASGEAVGLGWGEMGNSEVGHLNIGAGKIVYQSMMKITKAFEEGSAYKNEALLSAFQHVKKNKTKLHLLGLVSDGGIHSSIGHLYGVLEMARKQEIKEVYVHCFLDGRDTKYNDAINMVSRLNNKMKSINTGKIATLSGRFYAMDRDNYWERIEKSYMAMTEGKADRYFENPIEAIEKSYKENNFDEEFIPAVITDKDKKPITKIEQNDAIIFFNFRPDRAREMTKAFVMPSFEKFSRPKYIKNLKFVTFTEYEKNLPVKIAFPREEIANPLAKIISSRELKQLHIAETEKYAHATYFFNGGKEDPYPGEDNVIIPSPRVPSYSKVPEMSAKLLTKRVVEEIMKDTYDFIIINFANADMVGHTGNLEATVKAVKAVDSALKEIVELTLIKDGAVLITADHGNAEDLINERIGEIEKEHTVNPVPLIVIKKDFHKQKIGILSPLPDGQDLSSLRPSGVLADIAPTILKIMNIPKHKDMQGIALI
ncbi:2,3-bisphosphoglycerate-independent phosphoglycerate mutase [Candidatus Falkowbacteria bacterium]|jgi:2,3-bisphosphoglycerate-independent phosphoglycerate mutase|nr:2,3-bisphosphoglycerate-independent phosphoglycerate mutase [Candidatus Falkowbacteria bacterium]MBT4433081.1 2,3-bisphosphoglycerate-independent phosphoglycerate mutase [Candidatus Falkowbacteria bacterium]